MGVLLRESSHAGIIISRTEIVRSALYIEILATVTERVGVGSHAVFFVAEGIVIVGFGVFSTPPGGCAGRCYIFLSIVGFRIRHGPTVDPLDFVNAISADIQYGNRRRNEHIVFLINLNLTMVFLYLITSSNQNIIIRRMNEIPCCAKFFLIILVNMDACSSLSSISKTKNHVAENSIFYRFPIKLMSATVKLNTLKKQRMLFCDPNEIGILLSLNLFLWAATSQNAATYGTEDCQPNNRINFLFHVFISPNHGNTNWKDFFFFYHFSY